MGGDLKTYKLTRVLIMQDLINRLKNLKSASSTQVDKIINDHSYDTVLKELKDDGISINDLSDDEFKQILAEEVKKTKTFAKGALTGGAGLLVLELLG